MSRHIVSMFAGGCVSTRPAPLQPTAATSDKNICSRRRSGGRRTQGAENTAARVSPERCRCRCVPQQASQHLYFASMTASCCRWSVWPGRRLVSRHSSVPRIVRSKQTSPHPAPPRLPQNRIISSHQQEVGTENNPRQPSVEPPSPSHAVMS